MHEKEQYFIQTFIKNSRQERLLFEFSHPDKRYRGLSRFCHNAEDLLNKGLIALSGTDLERQDAFRSFLRQHSEPCRLISPSLEDTELPFPDAACTAFLLPDASITIGPGYALVCSEPERGGSIKYLLIAR
ncbi:MAG: hypothetical protein IKF51_01760 [Solobacterium sp.]|nr:hypothetical protein [Solobacterium sp.]